MTETNATKDVVISGASLAFFRAGFGLIMLFGLLRFVARGWVQAYYVEPTFFFSYEGLEWIKPWTHYGLPSWTLYAHIGVLCLCSLAIAVGWHYRSACLLFFLGFSYLELIDKTPYLNHYYAMSVIAFLMCLLPLDKAYAWPVGFSTPQSLPRWPLRVLRGQVALIYIFAGLAKLNGDWLWRAEPLRRWLPALSGQFPMGWIFNIPATAWAMAWAGMLFDLVIVFFLWHRRSRPWAYGLVVVFHGLTALLFPIGLFPWLMMFLALLFFEPEWPLQVLKRYFGSFDNTPSSENVIKSDYSPSQKGLSLILSVMLTLFFTVQLILPLRHHLYPGNVLWTEEGFRFAWNVMLIEKTGWVEFTVKDPVSGRFWVEKGSDLTPFQQRMMSTQPDMILQYAHELGKRHRDQFPQVEVYVESYAALNGRPSQYLIRPDVNLLEHSTTSGIIQPLQS